MLISFTRGQGSIIVRVKIRNSSVSTGAGLTGLTSASSGLIIGTIADNEATATVYTVAASNVETITTLGTYAAPTASKCRFKEVDATNHKGIYELQFADARFAVASSKSLLISIAGATNAAECDVVIPLTEIDPYDNVRLGITALPPAAADAAGGLPISDAGGLDLDAKLANTNEVTAARMGALTDWIDGGRLDLILDARASQTSLDAVDNFIDTEIAAIISTLGVAGAGLTDLGGFSTTAKGQIQTEAEDALVTHRLDELLNADSDIDGAAPPTVGSVFHELMSKTAGSFTFDQTTDSNEALRDRGDAAWITATGFSTLSQADIRTAVGLASANLDTQLSAIDDFLDTEIAAILAAVDTEVAAILVDTGTDIPATLTALFTTARTESYRGAGATGTIDQLLYEIIAHLGEASISSTTKTLKKLDGSTTAKTYTLNSATTPTSITETS